MAGKVILNIKCKYLIMLIVKNLQMKTDMCHAWMIADRLVFA